MISRGLRHSVDKLFNAKVVAYTATLAHHIAQFPNGQSPHFRRRFGSRRRIKVTGQSECRTGRLVLPSMEIVNGT